MNDDLDLFLIDFGKPVSAGAVTGLGILDMPGQVIADGMVMNTDYRLTVRTDQFGWLKFDDHISVDGSAFKVREAFPVEDGALTLLSLAKIDASSPVTIILNGDWL